VVHLVALVGIQIHQQAQHRQQQRVVQLLHLVIPVLSVGIKHQENITEFIGTLDCLEEKQN
jgi:hypothetical protein